MSESVRLCDFETLRNDLNELKKLSRESEMKETEHMKEIVYLKNKLLDLELTNKRLEDRLEQLDCRSRKMNILFYNVEELEMETIQALKEKVVCIVRNVIGLKGFCERDIKSVNRVGPRDLKKYRAVLVTLRDLKWKRCIISNLPKLKGSGIGIQEDFTCRTREVRRSLKEYTQKAREAGRKAYLRHDKLVIDGCSYTLEEIRKNIKVVLDEKGDQKADECYFYDNFDVSYNRQTDDMKTLDSRRSRFKSQYSNAELIKSADSLLGEEDSSNALHVYKGSMFTSMLEENEDQEPTGDFIT